MQQQTEILLELTDSRRLTGPNLWISGPGAILEVTGDEAEIRKVVPRWETALRDVFDQLGWEGEVAARPYEGGVNLAFEAPVDALYAATEINEAAFSAACENNLAIGNAETERLVGLVAEARCPKLMDLIRAARDHDVSCLLDDDEVSIGLGRHSKTWQIDEIPDLSDVDWLSVADIDVALITGTNGKSTTVRLTAAILQNAGLNTGFSSTDFVQVGPEIIDRGDYSGPGGAREVLRHPDVDTAVLEMARGGLLRRGLAMDRAAVACVTNIANDHLGEYGVNTLDELAMTKLLVARGLRAGRPLVLNADVAELRDHASSIANPIVWFSRNSRNETVVRHVAKGGAAFIVENDALVETSPVNNNESSVICQIA
ncbi:MAG: Mur ligase family protein, partial [Rhodothermia bacterium]